MEGLPSDDGSSRTTKPSSNRSCPDGILIRSCGRNRGTWQPSMNGSTLNTAAWSLTQSEEKYRTTRSEFPDRRHGLEFPRSRSNRGCVTLGLSPSCVGRGREPSRRLSVPLILSSGSRTPPGSWTGSDVLHRNIEADGDTGVNPTGISPPRQVLHDPSPKPVGREAKVPVPLGLGVIVVLIWISLIYRRYFAKMFISTIFQCGPGCGCHQTSK